MNEFRTYTLEEIRRELDDGNLPVKGITNLGSAEFLIREPAQYIGVALHSGSRIRPGILDTLEVSPEDRFREEDPYTDIFVRDFPLQIIARDSRFEYDLNWEIEKAVYPDNMEKWGLQVWKRALGPDELIETHEKYREFHGLLDLVVEHSLSRYGHSVLFDMHSFCYQRERRMPWWEDNKPEINLGTRSMDRNYFAPWIDRFMEGVSGLDLDGHPLRVAENELFPGGYLARKYATTRNRKLLVLAIEYKKIFMDEWSGELFPEILGMLRENLLLTKEAILRTKL